MRLRSQRRYDVRCELSIGVEGKSNNGSGVVGYTYFSSENASAGTAGVAGYDASRGDSYQNSGVYGKSTYGAGVEGQSPGGIGVVGLGGNESYGTFGGSHGSNSATFGAGIMAAGGGGTTDALDVELGSPDTGSAINVQIDTSPDGGGNVFEASTCGIGCENIASIDNSGDMILAGALTQGGSPLLRTGDASGRSVIAFGSRLTAPSIEDTGEAQLMQGEVSRLHHAARRWQRALRRTRRPRRLHRSRKRRRPVRRRFRRSHRCEALRHAGYALTRRGCRTQDRPDDVAAPDRGPAALTLRAR